MCWRIKPQGGIKAEQTGLYRSSFLSLCHSLNNHLFDHLLHPRLHFARTESEDVALMELNSLCKITTWKVLNPSLLYPSHSQKRWKDVPLLFPHLRYIEYLPTPSSDKCLFKMQWQWSFPCRHPLLLNQLDLWVSWAHIQCCQDLLPQEGLGPKQVNTF